MLGEKRRQHGRWAVHELAFPSGYDAALASADDNANGVIDSTAELELAFTDGTVPATRLWYVGVRGSARF